MRLFAAAIKELITLGVKGKALCDAIDRLEAATLRAPVSSLPQAVEEAARAADEELPPYDPAETRRRLDRERKRKIAESSGKIPQVSAAPPLPLPSSPQTPQQPTPTPPDITTRARGDAGFARFWLAYPRKTAKGDARKAFDRAIRKLIQFEDPEGLLIGALERAKASWGEAQYIPHPATWLNGERWEDEPETASPRKAHERPDHDPKFAARQANYARALAGADSAAGRTWKP